MSDQKDQPYTIAGREMIANTPDLRVQILTLTEGQEIPWHHHAIHPVKKTGSMNLLT